MEEANETLFYSSCMPWEEYLDKQTPSRRSLGLGILGICFATLVVNGILLGLIFSDDTLRKQVTHSCSLGHKLSLIFQRVNLFMASICCSDMCNAIFIIVFNLPGFSSTRFITAVNSSVSACKATLVLNCFCNCATYYNFLGRFGSNELLHFPSQESWWNDCMQSSDPLSSTSPCRGPTSRHSSVSAGWPPSSPPSPCGSTTPSPTTGKARRTANASSPSTM